MAAEEATPAAVVEEVEKLAVLDGDKKPTMLVSLAVLVLADGEKEQTAANIASILKASGNTDDASSFATAFAGLLKGRDALDMMNLGGGGGGGAAAGPAGGAEAAVEEKKEEEPEEEEEEVAMGGLMGGDDDAGW